MQLRWFAGCILLLSFIEIAHPICVLESDFGFKINCAFKKSGLFRVRNLGGLKAHASIGFSLGDELGFDQSLTNLDPSRRRSVSVKNGAPNLVDTSTIGKQEKRGKQNRIMMHPVAPPVVRPNQAAMDQLTTLHRRVSTMDPIIVSGPTVEPTLPRANPTVTMAKPMPMGVPAFKPLPPKEEILKVVPITSKTYAPLQIPQSKGPGLAYPSEKQSHNQISNMVSQMTSSQYGQQYPYKTNPIIVGPVTTVNPFLPMPSQGLTIIPPPAFKQIQNPNLILDPVPHRVHTIASNYVNTKKADDYNTIAGYTDDTMLKFNKEDINAKIAEIAKAGNISMEAVEAAIALRQQQLLSKYASLPTTTTTTSTTTKRPVVFEFDPEPAVVQTPKPTKRAPTSGKVMNAPREYYPVGYEKNFDDHFQSKVELPDTSFHCGDQKYFPGLYGDESLGCMVFHVCALTDDGLVMKSFLCPESTLFDQTILKCNWWFYVDCKNTRKLYDTNIPVSKSYQLMKALTFFSSYKKEIEDGQTSNPEDVVGVKEAISILENQDNTQPQNGMQIITPQPLIDERHKNIEINTEPAPIYRNNRNLNSTRNSAQRNLNTDSKSQESEFKLVTVNADLKINNTENSAETRDKKHRRRMTLRYSNVTSTTTTTTSAPTTTRAPTTKQSERNALIEQLKLEIMPLESEVKKETLTDLESSYKIDPASLPSNLPEVKRVYRSSAEKVNDDKEIELNKDKFKVIPSFTNLPEIKRFYRSSAEKIYEETQINNQKVEILSPKRNLPPINRFHRSSAEKVEEKDLENNDKKEIELINNEKVQIVRPTPISRLVGQFATPIATIAKLDEAILGNVRTKKHIVVVTPEKSLIEKT